MRQSLKYSVVMIAMASSTFATAQSSKTSKARTVKSSTPSRIPCPGKDSIIQFLKFVDSNDVHIKLKEDAERSGDTVCEMKTETMSAHIRDLMLTSLSPDPAAACKVFQQPEVYQSVNQAFPVGMGFHDPNHCDVFKP